MRLLYFAARSFATAEPTAEWMNRSDADHNFWLAW